METTYKPKIKYFVQRDFGQKINVTFEFIRENFKSLFKILLIVDGPLAAIFGFSYSYYQTSLFRSIGTGPGEMFNSSSILFSISIMMIAGMLLTYTFYAIILRYMQLYQEMAPAEITLKKITPTLFKDSGMLFAMSVVYFIPVMIGMFIFLIPGIYFLIAASLCFPIVIFEGANVIDAISRSFKLIKDKWWSTFGLLFIMGMIQGAIGMLFYIPMYAIMILQLIQADAEGVSPFVDNSNSDTIVFALASTISYIGVFASYSLGAIAISFQYFNLREKNEAVGLMSDIKSMEQVV